MNAFTRRIAQTVLLTCLMAGCLSPVRVALGQAAADSADLINSIYGRVSP